MKYIDAHKVIENIIELHSKAVWEYEAKIEGLLKQVIDAQITESHTATSTVENSGKIEELSARIQEQAEIISKYKNFVSQITATINDENIGSNQVIENIIVYKRQL